MCIFNDPYGVLTLNAMENLVNQYENPFMEWGSASVSPAVEQLLAVKQLEICVDSL